ncbi:MAG TPA: VWA domain-containing protein [Vicinamibacterales bacterium]|nr:VWA domain-containing protein [Vicinamibacterales bacterium]
MRTAHRFIRAAAWCLLTGSLLAQAPAAPAPPPESAPQQTSEAQAQPPVRPPTFRTGAELVRVDVGVFDRRGIPVRHLTADDFLLEEDGVPQPIQSFKFVSVNGYPEPGDEISLDIRSPEHARAEAARDDVRVFLIFWDEYHINRLTSAIRGREMLTRFVRSAFGPKDLVALMDPLTPIESIRFTRDRLELAEKIRPLRGRSGEYTPPRSVVEEAHLEAMRDIERLRSEVTMSALKSAAVHLGTLREGRKSIILISEGMRGLGRDEPSVFSDLIEAANASNTGIFTVNPLGLTMRRMRSFDMLESLAANTGAESTSSNDPGPTLLRVVSQASAYYLLGYTSRRPMDGKFHKIRVRVRDDHLEVRARSGYWAPSLAEMERARRAAAAAELPPDIARALAELPPPADRRTIDLWTGTALGTAGGPEVRVAWSPRSTAASAGRGVPDTVKVLAKAGTVEVFQSTVDQAGVSFAASPGPLLLTTSVYDSAGELIDRDTRTIVVPDLSASPLSISSPLVVRTQGPLQLREVRQSASPPPFAGREFQRTDRILVRFAVHGPEAGAAEVTATLMNRRAVKLTPLAVEQIDGTPGHWEIDLPLQTVARGDFLISIQAARGQTRADALVPLRIVR